MKIDQKFIQDHFGYSETLNGLYWKNPTSKYARKTLEDAQNWTITEKKKLIENKL